MVPILGSVSWFILLLGMLILRSALSCWFPNNTYELLTEFTQRHTAEDGIVCVHCGNGKGGEVRLSEPTSANRRKPRLHSWRNQKLTWRNDKDEEPRLLEPCVRRGEPATWKTDRVLRPRLQEPNVQRREPVVHSWLSEEIGESGLREPSAHRWESLPQSLRAESSIGFCRVEPG